jgi:predicted O-methyltransferase YrrM
VASPEPETAASLFAAAADAYVRERFAPEDDALRRIRSAMEASGLPTIQLPAATARAVQLLLRAIAARRVLEVGTLAGYSALWIVRALASSRDGEAGLVTVEIDPARAALARRLLDEAGVGGRVQILVGAAEAVLPTLGPDRGFDAVLLDADKEGLPSYLTEARRLLRPGGLLFVDNALWRGQVLDPAASDPATVAIRRSHDLIRADPEFDATLLPVGDGLLVALKR